ncbi:alpha/beta hydrolase [Fictibacillus nanhaiensis]|uniref:alpha/beta fold hydrolase n=1 Tax=Fictibacillus nanhaiensis TaxID=742169 RepID=UPI001C96BA4B|nr:alpha/beta hydrolase [Fictibacillus nanhaiensis]MBY6036525.1 alpha/beta hydrolase [Fictibacillus nanhaiensis]
MIIVAEKHQIASNDGTLITAYDHGGHGETILFLHYLGGCAHLWHPVIPHFVKNYRVLTYDLRGHGKSGQPDQGYTFEDTARDLEAVLNFFQIKHVHLVGSSYGCMVGTYFASTRAERVLSIVNSEGALVNDTGEDGIYNETFEEHISKFRDELDPDYESVDAYKQYYRDNWKPWNEARAYFVEHYEPRVKENGKVGPQTTGATMEKIIFEIFHTDFLKWYEKVECPVLFLPAEQEGEIEKKKRFIENASRRLSFSRTIVIPGTTHLMMYDHEVELVQAIKEFYAEIPVSTK